MKKFNIRKWMNEQKDLPKEKRSLTSNPIKNKTKESLSEQAAMYWSSDINRQWWEMLGGTTGINGDSPFIHGSNVHVGHLYACNGQGDFKVYRFTSVSGTDISSDYGGDATNSITGILDGEFIQQALHDVQNLGTFTTSYYNNKSSYDFGATVGFNGDSLDASGITPVDVIHYCKTTNGASLTANGETFVCPDMDTPCGGLHVGDATHEPVGTVNGLQPLGLGEGVCSDPQHTTAFDCLKPGTCHTGDDGSGPPGDQQIQYDDDPIGCYANSQIGGNPPLNVAVAGNGGNYQSDNSWTCPDGQGSTIAVGNGAPSGVNPFENNLFCTSNTSFYNLTYASFSTAPAWYTFQHTQTQVYSPSLKGYTYAKDNCNGPTGACDDSFYVFGCMDPMSIDYNEAITDIGWYDGSDLNIWDGSAWTTTNAPPIGEWYSGLTGTLNTSYGLYAQDPTNLTWSMGPAASGDPQGCGENGVPNPSNTDCCKYIGCPSRTGDSDYPMNNSYGLWDPTATYVFGANTSPTILSNVDAVIDSLLVAPRVIGCPSSTDPLIPDVDTDAGLYSCCQVVGCPKDYETAFPGEFTGGTSKFGGTQYEENDEPFTWEILGTLDQAFYDNNAYIGCDSAAVLTGGTATGIPDLTDYSCCTPHVNVDSNVGCNDPDALNYNMSTYGVCISNSQYIDEVSCTGAQETWDPAGTAVTATGCLNSDPASPYYQNAGDPSNTSCCNYEGCPDANVHPTITPTEYLATNAGHFGSSTLTLNIVNDPFVDGNFFELTSTDGNFGCDAGGGDIHGTTYTDCCTYPNFGCTDPVSHLYDATAEGCPEEYTIGQTSLYIKSTTPNDTTCCNYLGCFDTLDGNQSDAINFGVTDGAGYPTAIPMGGYDASLFPAGGYNINASTGGVGGVPDCITNQISAEASSPNLIQQTNYNCCMYDGCMNASATNYDSTATIPCNSTGLPWESPTLTNDNDCCSFGGCMDDTKNEFINPDTGLPVEYYLASNYNPDNDLDCANIQGGSDYSCCKYYTCKVTTANNFNYTPGPSSNFFVQDDGGTYIPSPYYINGTNLLDIGCPRKDYNIDDANGFDFAGGDNFPASWTPDYASDWCCTYKGCPDDNTPARNFTGDMVVQYPSPEDDPTKLLWGCNVDDPQFTQQTWDPSGFDQTQMDAYYACCAYEGCSDDTLNSNGQNLAVNLVDPNLTLGLPYQVNDLAAFYDNQMTCDPGFMNNPFGVDLMINPNNYTCCEYEGCTDPDALNFINISQGIGGCVSAQSGVWEAGDKSCCEYVGCPDNGGQNGTPTQYNGVAAFNYGVFAVAWNNPTVVDPSGVSDPTYVGSGGIFGCSLNGTTIETDAAGNPEDYYSCCQYVVGCQDGTSGPLGNGAVAGAPFPGVSYGADCPTCNYNPNALAGCYANSTNPGAQWSSQSVDDGVLTNGLAFGIIDPTNNDCCNYQWGCEFADLTAANIAGYVGNYDPLSYALGNYGCESTTVPGTLVDVGNVDDQNERYACCGDPIIYGCTDPQGGTAYDPINQVGCPSGYGGETVDPNTPSNYPYHCCDYSDAYSCGDNEGISVQMVNVAPNFAFVNPINMPGLTNTTSGGPSVGTLTGLYVHTFTGQLQPDMLDGNESWNSTPFELDTLFPGYSSWVNGTIGGQPSVAQGAQTPYWCKEIYEITDPFDSNYDPSNSPQHIVIHPECYSYYSVGCDGFPGAPTPSGYDCCMYDYGCPTVGADNHNYTTSPIGQRGNGCSSDAANTDVTDGNKWRGLPDITDTSCCEWTDDTYIGCNDPIAFNYKPAAVGCTDGTVPPDPNDNSCCEYFYLCNDPLASNYSTNQTILGGMSNQYGVTWGTAPGCDSTYSGGNPGAQPHQSGCDDAGGPASCYPDPADVSCCEYEYGCNQPNDGILNNATIVPFIVGSYGVYNTYHIGHKGCRNDGSNDVAPQFGIKADPSSVGCCHYAYGCPNLQDPATGNDYYGCDPTGTPFASTGFTTPTGDLGCCSGTDYGCNAQNAPATQVTNNFLDPSTGLPIGNIFLFPESLGVTGGGFHHNSNPGCADEPISEINTATGNYWFNTYFTPTTGSEPLPNDQNLNCCYWNYACADPSANPDYGANQLLNQNNPGCNPGITDPNNAAQVLTLDGGLNVISVIPPIQNTQIGNAIPDPNNTDCCTYPPGVYGCTDDTGNVGGTQALNYDQLADGCNPGNGGTPIPGDHSCCTYNYGCNDPDATPQSATNTGFQYYNSNHLGCHPESDYEGNNTGLYTGIGTLPFRDFSEQQNLMYDLGTGTCVQPSGNLTPFTTLAMCISPNIFTLDEFPSQPDSFNTQCCKYNYVCPIEGGSNWDDVNSVLVPSPNTSTTPVTNIGCHPDGTSVDSGPDFGKWVNSNTQCCIYQYACADDVTPNAVVDQSFDPTATTNTNNPGCNDNIITDYSDYSLNVNLGNFNTALNSTTPSNTTPWGSFNYGTNPPEPSNHNCCHYGCDGTNSTGLNNGGNSAFLLTGTLGYWPGALDWDIIAQFGVGSAPNFSTGNVYGLNSGDWPPQPFGVIQPHNIDPPLDEVCCVDTFANGYVANNNQTWTYVNTPPGCTCDWEVISAFQNGGTIVMDDANRWVEVSCDGKQLCEKCCLNVGLANASLGFSTPGSTNWYNGFSAIATIQSDIQAAMGAGVSNPSGTQGIIPYDVNNQDSWNYYMVPPYLHQNPGDPDIASGAIPNYGCVCTDNLGNATPDIIEIDCWSGWEITEEVPCLDEMSGDSAYGQQMYSTQLYAALGELYGLSPGVINPDGSFTPGDGISSDDTTNPYPDPTDMDGNCGCHIYTDDHPEVIAGNIPSSYITKNCGPVNHINGEDVFCDTVKVWDPVKNKCDWPCPRDWCWCKDRDITPYDPTSTYGIDTEWCCADPTTGIKTDCAPADPGVPYTNNHGDYTKILNTGQLDMPPYNLPAYNPAQGSNSQGTFNPNHFYILKDNWKNCDPVAHGLGATAWGYIDEMGVPDGTVSTPWFGDPSSVVMSANESNTTSGDVGNYPSGEPWVQENPPQMIIPESANCTNFYNEDETPKIFDSNGFPTAYWTCGCPDIHNFPSEIPISKTNNNGYNTSTWTYPAGHRLTFPGASFTWAPTNPSMTHNAHGCPGPDNEPMPIAYENGSVSAGQPSTMTTYPVSDDWEDKVNCCMPLPDEDELTGNLGFGGCPVERIEFNNHNYSSNYPYVNDYTYLILPDNVAATYTSNSSGTQLNPIHNGPENYILPLDTAGEYCVGAISFANDAQGDPSTFHSSVNKYSAPPPNWPPGAVCPPQNGYYEVLNYDPNSEGCVKAWFDASGGTSLSNGTTGISNDASNPSQMDLSCCELGELKGSDGLDLNDDPDWPGCTEATGGFYAWQSNTHWLQNQDGGATWHPDGVSIPRYGKSVANGQTSVVQGGGLAGHGCGCNLQLALYISELQMGLWTAASPNGGTGALDVVTQIEEWLAPIYGGAVANSIGMSIPYGEGPTQWFSNQYHSNYSQENPNIDTPQQIPNGVPFSAGEYADPMPGSGVYGDTVAGGWEGYGCPMCSIPVNLTGMSSYANGGDYYSRNKGGNTNLPSHMTPALSMTQNQPWNALVETQWDPGAPHIVINDSYFHQGCPDAQLNGLPNPLNLSCCEYTLITDPQQMIEYGCSPEMYEGDWNPHAESAKCEATFNCASLHNALGPLFVSQPLDPITSAYTGYDDSIWTYSLTMWSQLPQEVQNCACEDATDYIAQNPYQNQYAPYCVSIGHWCENEMTTSAKKAGSNCGATYSCKDVINFNEMLGGMKYTEGKTSTGLITLWPGSGIDEITSVMYSSITGEQENMAECTPEDAQDWLLGPDGEPLGQMTSIEEPLDEPRLDSDGNEFPPLEEPSELTEQMVSDEIKGTFNEQECEPLLGYYNLDFSVNKPTDGPDQTEIAIRQLRDLDPSDFDLKTITSEQCDDFFDGKQIQVDDEGVMSKITRELETAEKEGKNEDSIRLQRSLNYYKELSKYCNNLRPESCKELPEDSPWFISDSAECKKCANTTYDTIKVQGGEVDKIRQQILKDKKVDFENTNSDEQDAIVKDNMPKMPNIQGLDPNCQCCPNIESRILDPIETPEEKPTEVPTDVPTDEPTDTDVKPTDFELPTDKEPEITPEKTPEELEYERLTVKYEKEKEELLAQGWTEGNIDPEVDDPADFDTRILVNQDKVEVTFHKERPTTPPPTEPIEPTTPTEPVVTPDDFPLPTEPVTEPTAPPAEEPKITTSELKQMVKNAIREIKKDIKNGR